MRNLVPCTFEAGTRTIHIPLHEMTGVENIRLIVNETQKVVICSSMQKDNITSCVKDNVNGGWDVTYKNDIPALASGDALTVEIDLGLSDKFYIDGTDVILKAKVAGISGTPFVIGPEFGKLITDCAEQCGLAEMFSYTSVSEVAITQKTGTLKGLNALFRGCIHLVSADLSGITGSAGSFYNLFDGCSSLAYLNLANMSYKSGSNFFMNIDAGCSNLKTVVTHPDICTSGGRDGLLTAFPALENLTFSADASHNVYIGGSPLLTFASVKNVLEHCANTNMNGKTITFYPGLTIQDDADGTIQTLYNTVVDTYGANIANLTITPYSA